MQTPCMAEIEYWIPRRECRRQAAVAANVRGRGIVLLCNVHRRAWSRAGAVQSYRYLEVGELEVAKWRRR